MSQGDLRLSPSEREGIWAKAIEIIERYLQELPSRPVKAIEPTPEEVRSLLSGIDFNHPTDPLSAMDFVLRHSWDYQLHTSHPRYFGLFDPTPSTIGIAAEAITAGLNAQLGVWSSGAFANEIERLCLRSLAGKFGYAEDTARGTFTYGGTEANLSAMVMALAAKFPRFITGGMRALRGQPLVYVSSESHHSILKAARVVGLGTDSVREVPADHALRLDPERLSEQVKSDRKSGGIPFLVVGTAGTTKAGAIDPLVDIADIAEREGMWFHADAAWGGAVALVSELRSLLRGIERADSITFDPHKWLSVPLAAGLVVTRHTDALRNAFRIPANYLPWSPETDAGDPYTHSLEWSRRFTGLKVFLSLWTIGWEGYAAVIRRQVELAQHLRRRLVASGWQLCNETALPVVCFIDPSRRGDGNFVERLNRGVISSGKAWVSIAHISRPDSGTEPVLRACITSHLTRLDDVDALVTTLDQVREKS